MRRSLKSVIIGLCLASSQAALACPDGQYRACILPRPWGGCTQYACVPKIKDPVAVMTRASRRSMPLAPSSEAFDAPSEVDAALRNMSATEKHADMKKRLRLGLKY